MLKFMVVLYKRADMSTEDFFRHVKDVHGPLARKLPGLRKYVQNRVAEDTTRRRPGWEAIVELWFDDWASMEAAWASPEGAASDADLPLFTDLTRTTWSVVDETIVLE